MKKMETKKEKCKPIINQPQQPTMTTTTTTTTTTNEPDDARMVGCKCLEIANGTRRLPDAKKKQVHVQKVLFELGRLLSVKSVILNKALLGSPNALITDNALQLLLRQADYRDPSE